MGLRSFLRGRIADLTYKGRADSLGGLNKVYNPESFVLKDFDFIKRSLSYVTNGLQAVTYMGVKKCIID